MEYYSRFGVFTDDEEIDVAELAVEAASGDEHARHQVTGRKLM